MKNIGKYARGAVITSLMFPFMLNAQDKSIYGNDDRLDYYQASPAMRQLADSVVSLWPSKQVKLENGEYKLATVNYGEAVNLCPGETFSEQPIGSFCSGTLVGPDIIMTAGHCITDEAQCADTKFVFGYNIGSEGGKANTSAKLKDLYNCKRIIKRDLDKQPGGIFGIGIAIIGALLNKAGPDYALVQLDRPVEGRKPLPVNRNGSIGKGESVFVIGHPVGLPAKITGGGTVRDNSPKSFFLTDLDTFGGNSGSAVFNARTNLIEGVLVRGGTDFADTEKGCKVQVRTGQNEGRGEAVTKISKLSKYIPLLKSAEAPVVKDMTFDGTLTPDEALEHQIRF
ncbi:MAG: serine protease [Elusimicrobia bacterium CG08_land_8_20_14_0_20_51_18]|nr:MAG: serine protease [Elusimicrobia bacterium CG08_land_8_20_14_0_20_51_18]